MVGAVPAALRRASDQNIALMDTVLVGPPDAEIVALESRLRAAQLAADVAALDALIADELLFTGPDGELGTKGQDLYTRVWAREAGGPWRVAGGHVSEVPPTLDSA
jgi:hypothetical protein